MLRRTLLKLAVLGTAITVAPAFARTGPTATANTGTGNPNSAHSTQPERRETMTADAGKTELIRKDVVVTRLFDAPVERVWRAFTEDAEVMKWWGPQGFTSPAAKMDVRPGGVSLVCMRSPQGQDMWMTWAYTKVEPLRRLDYVQNLSDEHGNRIDPAAMGMGPEFPRDVATVVTLTPRGDKTEMKIVEDTTTTEFMHEMSRVGLEQCMDKMAASFKS
jgi:uncharacterized protein YndB with AHSA1/START domain